MDPWTDELCGALTTIGCSFASDPKRAAGSPIALINKNEANKRFVIMGKSFRGLTVVSESHFTNSTSGLSFSTTYVPTSVAVTLPTFFAAWGTMAGITARCRH
jgi:hypothetical protein